MKNFKQYITEKRRRKKRRKSKGVRRNIFMPWFGAGYYGFAGQDAGSGSDAGAGGDGGGGE